jgi:K(+)-stimulated pyrophosphate-energized sodium pump
MIYSLSIGMMSVVIPAAVTITAMVVSYKFANFYGVALASIGINSMAGVNSAVRGFSINTASSSEITSVIIDSDESPNPADVLLTASVRTDVIGKTYSAVATIITLTAMFTALSIAAGSPSADLMNTSVFLGIATGAVFVFVCAGFIIRSIRLTATVLRERLDDLYDDEKHINTLRGLVPLYAASLIVPAIAGALGGITGIIAFTCSVTVTGMCMLYAFNNSGKYFDRMATETLGNVIKVMVVAAIVFAPVFMKFGGVL